MNALGTFASTSYFNVSSAILAAPPPVVFNRVPQLVPLVYEFPIDNRRSNHRHFIASDPADVVQRLRTKMRRRRGANVYRSDAPKEARLYSRSSRGFLKVDPITLTVSSDRHGNSIYDVIEVIFLCQAAAALLGKCPAITGLPDVANTSSSPPWTIMDGASRLPSSSRGSLALLRFNAVQRYLCIDSRARVVLKEKLEDVEECAFLHDTFSDQYDAYYSWKYPASSLKSRDASCDINPDTSDCRDHRHRRRRWYLGVAKNGTARTFISASDASAVPRHRTMFVQRWTSRVGHAHTPWPTLTLALPSSSAGLTNTTLSGGDVVSAGRKSPSKSVAGRPCSRLLRHCRRLANRRHGDLVLPRHEGRRNGVDGADQLRQQLRFSLGKGHHATVRRRNGVRTAN